MESLNPDEISLRQFLVSEVLIEFPQATLFEAVEGVSSTAIEHPEWDLDERRTWDEWREWTREP